MQKTRMIQRIERADAFPVRSVSPLAIERVLPAAGSTLALPSGEIAGDFRATGRVDKRHRETYELLVANNTAVPIATFAYSLEGCLQARVTWDAIVVPAFSAIAVDLDVPLGTSHRRPRMIAEVYTHDSHLTLDATLPVTNGIGRSAVRKAVAALAALAFVASGSIAYAAMHPHIVALAAPATVPGGTSFSVAYAAHGADGAAYTVATPDGHEIAGGRLDPRSSAFTVALPRGRTALGYDVRLVASGALGEDARTAHVVALAPPQVRALARANRHEAPLRVSGLALASDVVDGGRPIVVTYQSSVPNGSVRLVDQYGTVRGETLISGRGRSTLAAPFVDADQDLRVVVRVERGGERAEAAVPVTIRHVDQSALTLPGRGLEVPAPVAIPGDATQSAADQTPETPADAAHSNGPPLSDASEPAAPAIGPPIQVDVLQVPGRPVRVRILQHDAGLHISMMGPDGAEIVSENVSPGASTILLAPPDLRQSTGRGYSIVATFSRGVAQETLIRPIVFRAP